MTRVGRLLRKTSLDELPQLWNVLRREMSLVGPRPIVEDEIPKYSHYYDLYTKVSPGISGLWQVSGATTRPTSSVSTRRILLPQLVRVARRLHLSPYGQGVLLREGAYLPMVATRFPPARISRRLVSRLGTWGARALWVLLGRVLGIASTVLVNLLLAAEVVPRRFRELHPYRQHHVVTSCLAMGGQIWRWCGSWPKVWEGGILLGHVKPCRWSLAP